MVPTDVLEQNAEAPTDALEKVEAPKEQAEDKSVLSRLGRLLKWPGRQEVEGKQAEQAEPEIKDTLEANLASYKGSPFRADKRSAVAAAKVTAARDAVMDFLSEYVHDPTLKATELLEDKVLSHDEFTRLQHLMKAGITQEDLDRVSKLTDEDLAQIDGRNPTQKEDIPEHSNQVMLSGKTPLISYASNDERPHHEQPHPRPHHDNPTHPQTRAIHHTAPPTRAAQERNPVPRRERNVQGARRRDYRPHPRHAKRAL